PSNWTVSKKRSPPSRCNMITATLRRRLMAMQVDMKALQHRQTPGLARYRKDPARILTDAGMNADPWQARILRATWNRALPLCGRQTGKSQVAGALALVEALTHPRSLILLLSPTLRQSGELFRDKLLPLWRAIGRPLQDRPPTQLSLELTNGSR